jgi:hypothetical protein
MFIVFVSILLPLLCAVYIVCPEILCIKVEGVSAIMSMGTK